MADYSGVATDSIRSKCAFISNRYNIINVNMISS